MKTTPEQRAKLKSLADSYFDNERGAELAKGIRVLIADLEDAQSKLAAAEKDAERYQYLKGCVDIADDGDNSSEWWELHFEYQTGCKLDEAIDAAIAAQEQQP